MAILQWTHQDPISPWCDFRWVRPIRSPVFYAPGSVGLSTQLGRMTIFLGASTTKGVNFQNKHENIRVSSHLVPYMDSRWWISRFKPYFNTSQADYKAEWKWMNPNDTSYYTRPNRSWMSKSASGRLPFNHVMSSPTPFAASLSKSPAERCWKPKFAAMRVHLKA